MAKRLQTYATDDVVVTFDPNRCIHAAACVRGLPQVFDPRLRRWVRPELASPAQVAEVVARCPTGALQATLRGASAAPTPTLAADAVAADAVTVAPQRNGPLFVRGPVRLVADDGLVIHEGDRVALCRCGRTGNAPFCDGSHFAARFRDA